MNGNGCLPHGLQSEARAAELARLQTALDKALADLERAKRLYEAGASTKDQLARAEEAVDQARDAWDKAKAAVKADETRFNLNLKSSHLDLYADRLLRFYGFKADEILGPESPFLSLELEPKTEWALRHPERFPVEVNRADLPTLLRTPGIGLTSARRIVDSRRHGQIRPEDLPRLGVVMKRARYFLTCQGKAFERLEEPAAIRGRLLQGGRDRPPGRYRQLSLFGSDS